MHSTYSYEKMVDDAVDYMSVTADRLRTVIMESDEEHDKIYIMRRMIGRVNLVPMHILTADDVKNPDAKIGNIVNALKPE